MVQMGYFRVNRRFHGDLGARDVEIDTVAFLAAALGLIQTTSMIWCSPCGPQPHPASRLFEHSEFPLSRAHNLPSLQQDGLYIMDPITVGLTIYLVPGQKTCAELDQRLM
jgi:hypothetical protein